MRETVTDSRAPRRLLLTVLAILIAHQAAAQHRVFVTSTRDAGDLSAWADSGGLAGLEAADAICRAHAQRGGLPGADDYVAWISDSSDDAYCRLHGLSGKRDANCGQATLPSTAGPWTRMDGHPFGGSLVEMTDEDRIYVPTRFDESGSDRVGAPQTGTDHLGRLTPDFACADWTSDSESLSKVFGSARATGRNWTGGFAIHCGALAPLVCMRRGSGPPAPLVETPGRRAFVTDQLFDGDLASAGGVPGNALSAADGICAAEARSAALEDPDSFRAWLSTSAVDAPDRIQNDGPWVRVDGVLVAASKTDLVAGALRGPLNQTATGDYVNGFDERSEVWSGAGADGDLGPNCSDWTADTPGDFGLIGESLTAGTSWSRTNLSRDCGSAFGYRLYCFQDVPFVDRCVADEHTLCLGADNRFRVRVAWDDGTGPGERMGTARSIGTRDSGLVWFTNPDNIEMLIKILPGCAITGHYWVFYAATTTLRFELTIEDLVAGETRTYTNPLGMAALPVTDTTAFDTCP